jgi:hypothetical protein
MEASLARQKYTVRLLYKKVITTVLKQTIFYMRARSLFSAKINLTAPVSTIFHSSAGALI